MKAIPEEQRKKKRQSVKVEEEGGGGGGETKRDRFRVRKGGAGVYSMCTQLLRMRGGGYPGAPCAVYQPAPQLHTPASLCTLQLGQSIMGNLLTCFRGLQLEFTDCKKKKKQTPHMHSCTYGRTWPHMAGKSAELCKRNLCNKYFRRKNPTRRNHV